MPDNIKGGAVSTILIVQTCSIAQIEDFFIALQNFYDSKIIDHPFLLKKAKTVLKHWPRCTWHLENYFFSKLSDTLPPLVPNSLYSLLFFLNPSLSKIVLESSEFDNIEELNAEQRLMRFHQKNKIVLESSEFQSIEELDAKIQEYVGKDENGKWKCNFCDKILSTITSVKSHAEIHFENIAFRCQFCYAKYSTRNSLRDHKSKKHYAEML